MTQKKSEAPKCPRCGAQAIPIVYGYIPIELMEEERRGKIKIGGCITDPENPNWFCKKCNYSF